MKCSAGRGEPYLKKSDCHLHATLEERINALHKLRFQHSIKLLCKVLEVNRSTYYKRFHSEPASRVKENQEIAKSILNIYADYHKRLGAYKITHVLNRDYGIKISVGRVYRLIKTLQLPRMSTDKPFRNYKHKENGECPNFLEQKFNLKTPNTVWTSDFTFIKVNGKWYYLCIVMDLLFTLLFDLLFGLHLDLLHSFTFSLTFLLSDLFLISASSL